MYISFKNKWLVLVLGLSMVWVNLPSLLAQEAYQVTSPYHTIYTFLDNLQSDNFNPSLSARTLNANGYTSFEKEALAVKLIQVLDGKGLYVKMDELPRNSNYIDSLSQKNRYVLFASVPEIYVEKIGNLWLFSSETVKAIPRLHQEVYPMGLDYLLDLIPKGANKKFLGLNTWQYVGLLVLSLLSILLHKLLSFFLGNILMRFFTRIRTEVAKKLIQPIARPLSLLIVCLVLTWLVPVLSLPVSVNWLFLLFLKLAIPIYIVMIGFRVVDFISVYIQRHAESTASTLDDQLAPLIRKSLKIVISLLGFLYVLQNLEFNITALVAGLSIGTLAFALAAQDTIKNLFGSITIFLDRPFQVGDWIVADDIDGSIEEVGFRSTRVRTFHNSLIYIPNGRLADMTIDNMGLRVYRRYRTSLALTYDTPPELIEAFVEGLHEIVQKHPDTRKDNYHIYLNHFNATSLDVLFYIFFQVPDWATELRARQEVMLAILRLAKTLGVRFAFPTQSLHIEDFPGQKSLSPEYNGAELEKSHLRQRIDQFSSALFTNQINKSSTNGKPS
jgi:MscS family membrane protein